MIYNICMYIYLSCALSILSNGDNLVIFLLQNTSKGMPAANTSKDSKTLPHATAKDTSTQSMFDHNS